jgi:PAS domain S-box-containing protein
MSEPQIPRHSLAAILRQMPGGIGLFDTKGQLHLRGGLLGGLWDEFMPWSGAYATRRWRGVDADGNPLTDSQHPCTRALRGEVAEPGVDFLNTVEDVREVWIRMSAAPFLDENGRIRGVIATLKNVDRDKRAQKRLRESEAKLTAAARLVGLGLYSWNPQTNELQWDRVARAMWGLPPNAPLDRDLLRTSVHPDDRERVENAFARSIDPAHDGVYDVEYRVNGSDGIERWVATRGEAEFKDGKAVSFHGANLDITKSKKMEDALEHQVQERTRQLAASNIALNLEIEERRNAEEHLNRLKFELFHASRLSVAGQMAAAIAHELSQPLAAATNAINAMLRRLQSKGADGDPMLLELAAETAKQAERAREIIDRLRNFIRGGTFEREAETIQPMIEEAVAFTAVGTNALGVTISYYFDPAAPVVWVDRVQFQQVVSNLVRNALEAMEDQEQRALAISTAADLEGQVVVSIADNGPGLTEEVSSNLFKPFMTTKPGGMGLGLAICKSIVEEHGGGISYEPAPGKGAMFRFTLETPDGGTAAEVPVLAT